MSFELQNCIEKLSREYSILDYSSIGHCIINEDFIVLFWNKSLESWSKINRAKILGASLLTHFPHLKNVKYLERIRIFFKSGVPTVFSSQLHKHIIPCPLPGNKTRIQQTVISRLPRRESGEYFAFFSIQDETDLSVVIRDNQQALQLLAIESDERKKALEEVKTLRGILPVCCVCGLIRDDTGIEHGKVEWMKLDKFVTQKTDAQVSHSYCPKCFEKAMEDL